MICTLCLFVLVSVTFSSILPQSQEWSYIWSDARLRYFTFSLLVKAESLLNAFRRSQLDLLDGVVGVWGFLTKGVGIVDLPLQEEDIDEDTNKMATLVVQSKSGASGALAVYGTHRTGGRANYP
jgi:hypothetical protein